MKEVSMNRAYNATLSWYRTGRVGRAQTLRDDTWRNRGDGTYFAVGGFEKDSSLQGVVDACVARRRSEWGLQYHSVEIVITSACARCDGFRDDPVKYRGKAKNCTLCKGKATDRHELSITL
jgi:hypothetical protein